MISPASLLHTPLTTPPSKHFCSWLSCFTEACFRVFGGKNEQTMNRRDHTAQHTLSFVPSTGHGCPMALDMHKLHPFQQCSWEGMGKQGIPCLPVKDKDICRSCRSCRSVLSLSFCASGCTPGLCCTKKDGALHGERAGRRMFKVEEKNHHNLGGPQLG